MGKHIQQSYIGLLTDLQTTDKSNIVNAINEMKASSGKTKVNSYVWSAVANQTVFTIGTGSYIPNQGNMEVHVGGKVLISGTDYTETSPTTFKLLTITDLEAGDTVYAKWFENVNLSASSTVVEDNLTSSSSANALSANQGKSLNSKIGVLSNLTTTAKTDLVSAVNEINTKAGNTKISEQSWTAGVGQTVFNLTSGSYITGKGTLQVFIGGIALVSGVDYIESSPTSFTLTNTDLNGEIVYAKWFEQVNLVANLNPTKVNAQSWTATANQTVFTLTSGTYLPGKANIEVHVGGNLLISGVDYTETSGNSFTLLNMPDLNGELVYAKWFENVNLVAGNVTVEDSLTSTNNTNALSANQGRILSEQLADISQVAVSLESYNPDGTGTTDSTTAFINAVNKANSITKATSFPVGIDIAPGTYILNKTSDLVIPSLICKGGVAKLIVQDAYSFIINSNFCLSNIQVFSTLEYANTDSSYKPLFKATGTVENISFNNVVFDAQLSVQDGTKRANACIDLKIVNHLRLNNFVVKGYRRGITSMGVSTDIKGDMLHFENVELAIYVQGSDPNVTNTSYAKNIQFTNVSHINTPTQAGNYFKKAGADTFLFEKCDTVMITNVTTEYPIERASYCSSCNNVVFSHWQIKHGEGIKFVGNVRNDTGINNIADTCRLSNISIVTNITDAYLACFYFAKNITVKNCTINGTFNATSAISTMHYVENLVLENNYAENLKRGFLEFTYYGDIAAAGSIPMNPAGNYPSGINGMKAMRNTIKGSHSIAYPVFKMQDLSGTTLTAGVYRYFNIVLQNNIVDNTQDDMYGTVTGQFCQGLISINDVKNIRMTGNEVNGYALNDASSNQITVPYQIGSNSYNVQIKHKEIVRNRDHKYFWGTLYVSGGTEFEMITSRYNESFEDRAVVSFKPDTVNPLTTKDISQNFSSKGTMYIHNITDIAIPLIGYGVSGYTLPALFGMVEVVGSADTGTGKFVLKGDGTTTLLSGSSTLYTNAVTSAKFAIFKDGTYPRYTLRYLAGTSMGFIINYNLSVV